MKEKFEMKPEHIRLITRMYVEWQEAYDGAPAIGVKRPYGNSFVLGDVAEILGWNLAGEGEDGPSLSEEQQAEAVRLHEETNTALQIVLCCQTFEPGRFVKTDQYCSRSWKRAA